MLAVFGLLKLKQWSISKVSIFTPMPKPGYSTIRVPFMDELRSISQQTNKPISNLVEEALSIYLSQHLTITYRAYYQSNGEIIYSNKQSKDIYNSLPSGSWPIQLGNDLKDPYDGAKFTIHGLDRSMDVIIVEKEKIIHPKELKELPKLRPVWEIENPEEHAFAEAMEEFINDPKE